MSVIGSISIKDNATAVLKSIRNEQTAFRKDVAKTKSELKAAWDKQYKAKLEATAAAKKAKELRAKLEPLRKKVVTAMAVKDMATDKVKSVAKKVKEVGKLTARPVVNIAVKGAQALSGIGKQVAGAAKIAAVGIGAAAAIGTTALSSIYAGSEEAAKAQIEAETKLEAVLGNVADIKERGAGAVQAAKQQLMGVASELQGIGVIGDEVTLAGMQQLATFQLSEKEISTLAGGMTDLLAQQKGLNATQEDAVGIANMIGKAMTGQASALSRVGITFDEAQKKALETGTAEQKAAVLAQILQQNVGGVNQALAETDQGRIQQVSNAYGDMKEEVGKLALSMKARLSTVVMKNIPTIQKLGTVMISTVSRFADKAIPVIDKAVTYATPVIEGFLKNISGLADELVPIVSDIFSGLKNSVDTVRPFINTVLSGFREMQPQLASFAGTVFNTVQQVAVSAVPVITDIITTIQSVLPSVLPVLETVFTTIGSVLSQAAPVISGLVTGIGTAVSALAPVFGTVFSEIGEKVGSVLSFVGERMGFIQEVIETAAPLVADILSTAWSVISPVMDIAVSTFKILFSVVQKVFPGIQSIIESVWSGIKPLIEGIGSAVGTVAGWFGDVADFFTGGSDSGTEDTAVGTNADGDNNWKGGLTWVGEKGPELVELPKGSRILPNKESMSMVRRITKESGGVKEASGNVIQNILPGKRTAFASTGEPVSGIMAILKEILDKIRGNDDKKPEPDIPRNPRPSGSGAQIIIQKLADKIEVRKEEDIDEVADRVAKKVLEVAVNMG